MGYDKIDEAKRQSERLLKIENDYNAELLRIRDKQEQSETRRDERNYKIQLSKAKTSVQTEKLRLDRLDELEKQADDEYLRRLKESLEKESAERDKHFRDIKYNLDTGVISESEYYEQLSELRDTYFEEGSQQWQKYGSEIAQYNRTVAEQNKKIIVDILSETADKISSAREKVEKNLDSYTSLYKTVNTTYKKAGPYGTDFVITKTYLSDLKSQTQALREYADALTAVKERAQIPEELFDELRSLDVESGLRFANALLDADDAEFSEYIEAYREHKSEISRLAEELTEENTQKAISVMKSKLEEVYGEIPDDFWQCGFESAQSFGDAFGEELEKILADIKKSVQSSMSEAIPTVSAATGTQNTSSYTASYNFYGSGETVSAQLRAARSAAAVERMRGGYDV